MGCPRDRHDESGRTMRVTTTRGIRTRPNCEETRVAARLGGGRPDSGLLPPWRPCCAVCSASGPLPCRAPRPPRRRRPPSTWTTSTTRRRPAARAQAASACKTIQEGVNAADLLTDTAITLDIAGSATNYDEMVQIVLPASDSLVIDGTGSTQPTLDDGGSGSNITIIANDRQRRCRDDRQHDGERRRRRAATVRAARSRISEPGRSRSAATRSPRTRLPLSGERSMSPTAVSARAL